MRLRRLTMKKRKPVAKIVLTTSPPVYVSWQWLPVYNLVKLTVTEVQLQLGQAELIAI